VPEGDLCGGCLTVCPLGVVNRCASEAMYLQELKARVERASEPKGVCRCPAIAHPCCIENVCRAGRSSCHAQLR
jgi:hypothetical protein